MLGVWDRFKPKKMCFYGILGHDTRFNSFKGGEVIRSKVGKSDRKNAHLKKTSWYSSLQQFSPILSMFCEKNCIHYDIDDKINVEIKGVHLESRMPRCMGDHKMKICGGPNSNCTKLGDKIPCTYICIQFCSRGYAGPNLDDKCDQLITYVLWLLSSIEKN